VRGSLCAGIDEPENRAGHVRRKRRPAALIGHDPQRVDAFGELPLHRFDEVVAVNAEEPRRAQDEMALRMRGGDFTEELRAAVGGEGVRRIVRFVGGPLRPVEDEIGGDLYQLRAGLIGRAGEQFYGTAVDGRCGSLVLLRVVDPRPCRAVDDDIGLRLGDAVLDEPRVGDVELRA
jgi:hypothetical protein